MLDVLKMVRGVFGVLVILVNTCNLQGPVAFVRLANVLYAGMCYVMLWFVPSLVCHSVVWVLVMLYESPRR